MIRWCQVYCTNVQSPRRLLETRRLFGVAPEWSTALMPGMHRSGPKQKWRRVAAAGGAEPGL